jgi:molybdenum cofactor cytidylyltransferase
MLRRVTRAFVDAGFDDVVVVLQNDEGDGLQPSLRRVIEEFQPTARCVENPDWRTGMFTSVGAGLAAVEAAGHSTHVAVSPADLPFLGRESLGTILSASDSVDERTLLVPTHKGRRGHPLLFSTALIPRILSWPGGRRLSSLFEEPDLSVRHLDGFDDGILRDVDCPGDLR